MQAPGSIERWNQPRWSTVCWRFSLYGDLATHAFNPTPLTDYMQLKAYSLWQLSALLSVSRQRWTSKTLLLLSLSPLRLLLPPPMLPLLLLLQRYSVISKREFHHRRHVGGRRSETVLFIDAYAGRGFPVATATVIASNTQRGTTEKHAPPLPRSLPLSADR